MKKNLLFYFLCVGLLTFSSCQKELIDEIAPLSEEESAEKYLQSYPVNVIFANIKIDHQKSTLTGYMIDKWGNLKYIPETSLKVLIHAGIENGKIPIIPIRTLYFHAEDQKALDPIELKEYAIKAYSLNQSPEVSVANVNAEVSYYKFNFIAAENSSSVGNSTCNTGYNSGPEVAQIIIQTQGQMSMGNDLKQKEISEWLDTFESDYSFLQ